MLALTDSAVEAARSAVQAAEGMAAGLRVMVKSGGCAGMQYGLQLEEAPAEDDQVIEYDGLAVYVDPESFPVLSTVTLDFVQRLEGAGFTFANSAATKSCGCGKSFTCG